MTGSLVLSCALQLSLTLAPGKSVYELHPWLDGLLIGGGTLSVALPYAYDSRLITPRCPCDPAEVNRFDRGAIGKNSEALSVVTDAGVALAVMGPLLFDLWDVGWSRAFVEDTLMQAEVLALNGALVTLAKFTTQRPLPRVYALQAPELIDSPGGYRAFYSGHTAVTVAALTSASVTYTRRHGPSPWPWLVTAALGTTVAVGRVEAGWHFYSDVIVGAAAGFAVGFVVPTLHRRPPGADGETKPGESRLGFVPLAGGGGQFVWSGAL